MRSIYRRLTFAVAAISLFSPFAYGETPTPKKIVLIAGPKSHGPVGNGIHDYPWSVKLLKVMLDNSNVADQVRVEYHLEGWPADPTTLDDADAIMVVSDGRDGDLYAEAPHFANEEHLRAVEKQIRRGCGFLTFHFSTFAPDAYAERILDWSGGYFDWETDGKRQWYSNITTKQAEVTPVSPEHPVSRGLTPFTMNEEFYFDIRFQPGDAGLTPIWMVSDLPGREPDGRVVAWAKERADGGRGFGTTCGHFYENWKQENFRRLILNALVWAAKGDVPAEGVAARYYTHAEVTAALTGAGDTGRAVVDDRPIKALVLTGAHHPAHLWRDTSPALREVLERDPRIKVDISADIEDLATEKLRDYDLLVFNYCNWERPGLSDAAKAGFVRYLEEGGGLCLIHFANGAFHFSLPGAAESDWPEYREICRRVWDHTPGTSGHDAFGPFVVEIENPDHPVTRGLAPFRTNDELYFSQQGDRPIEVLAKARSNVTGKWEPMAFVYEYGKGRVLQTVLGHAAESIRNEGTAAILRRGAAWVARRNPASDGRLTAPPDAGNKEPLGEGRFGRGLNAKNGGRFAANREDYRTPPLTVECWTKIDDRTPYNILVAQEPKTSATHWELFGMAGDGRLTAYLPGMEPDHVRSDADVCDGVWHHVAMIYEPTRIRLFVDGQRVADQPIARKEGGESVPGPLGLGVLATGELGCAGLIDDVRITKGVREITAVPEGPLDADEEMVGLWRFEELDEAGGVRDESSRKNPAVAEPPAVKAAAKSKIEGHWGEDALGFRWTEQDSVDNRWNRTNVGRFLASIVPLPDRPPVAKGLSIQIGDQGEATICYDTARMAARAAWTDGFLKFDPARFGLIAAPSPAGPLMFTADESAGWGSAEVRYGGMSVQGDRVVLTGTVDGIPVRESPWIESHGGLAAITRTIEVGPTDSSFAISLFDATNAEMRNVSGRPVVVGDVREGSIAVAVVGDDSLRPTIQDAKRILLVVPASKEPRRFKIVICADRRDELAKFGELLAANPKVESLDALLEPGPPRWTESIETRGTLGSDDAAYTVDTITLPFENPYNALFFVSGHDFLPNGDVALCTAHGDVWLVSGVDETLERLIWKRFATGLFQPLGLKVVDDKIFVIGRDQITRLHDENGDGEADRYECFSNLHVTSPSGHDYVAGLETDADGNFYFVHATQGLVRVSNDGRSLDIVATGFRNPNGMSVGPDGTMTVAPQEGEWTPGSCVIQVRPGGHYGYPGPKPAPDRPLGYDPPLCWVPRLQDNSSGGQVWVTSERWGPFAGQLLHLSYGKCRMMLVLRETIDGQTQGGVIDFPLDFDSGVMRGRFSPHDGQLYVSGLRGWTTSAARDGCLQRVRYTGRPVDFPVATREMRNGVAITFTRPLDPVSAEDPGSYQIEQWDYRYGSQYGSPEYRPSDPRQEGRDEVKVLSATLLDDRTVFLEIAEPRPVMQRSIRYSLRSADGTSIRQTIASTLHRIGTEEVDPSRLRRHDAPSLADAPEASRLEPGVTVRFEQVEKEDSRPQRLIALDVPAGRAPTPYLNPGRFTATFEGWVEVPLRGDYRLSLDGAGRAALSVNGREAQTIDRDSEPVLIPFHKGFNRITVRYESPADGDAVFRLLWSSEEFPAEPIPPTALFQNATDGSATTAEKLRHGRELFLSRQCGRCHGGSLSTSLMAEAKRAAPDLRETGHRLNPAWITAWLLDPKALRHDATMPRLFDANDPNRRRHATDIAAYLSTLGPSAKADKPTSNPAETGAALYVDLGCVGCHRLTPPDESDEYDRVSLHFAGVKYHDGALAEFLRHPHALHVGIRMPDFGLSEAEASSLATYLEQAAAGHVTDAATNGDPIRGRELFGTLRCGNCHLAEGPEVATPTERPLWGDAAERGCLAAEETTRQGAPVFGFDSDERDAVMTFLNSTSEMSSPTDPTEVSTRLFETLRCAACHDRDGVRSPRTLIAVEEAGAEQAPDPLPDLTWAGEKFEADWTARLIAGDLDYRCRPQLKARMPAFPAYAEALAAGFAAEHAVTYVTDEPFQIDAALAETGRRLALPQTGLDCRQCHGVGSDRPLGDERTLIAPGINFSHVRDRLRHDFYRRFVLDPPRYEIATKMPKLSVDGRTTKIREIYDGDAARQFEALWHYIVTSPPEKSESAGR